MKQLIEEDIKSRQKPSIAKRQTFRKKINYGNNYLIFLIFGAREPIPQANPNG